MTIKEAVEYLRKEKGCRTLEANICFSKSCEECEYALGLIDMGKAEASFLNIN